MQFPNLFSPLVIKSVELRNRIVSTGHDTNLAENGLPSDALVAYHRARARGGAGLVVIQVVGVHETARYTGSMLMGASDDCIPSFRCLIESIHVFGAKVIVQLFHPGREVIGRRDGIVQPAYAPSASPSERFRVIPRPLSRPMIEEILAGYGATARRMVEAGVDGVEIVASHGYLPAQFMNPNVNHREDEYGGTLENRLRFAREAIARCRSQVSSDTIVGIRLSVEEHDAAGMMADEAIAAN